MATKQSIEREEGSPRPLLPEHGDNDDDGAVLRAAEIVLLAHEKCVRLSGEDQAGAVLAVAVEPRAYAEARASREGALRKLIETRARGRRGLSAKKIVLGILVTWLGSEDPNCSHAMRLLDEYDLVMADGKNSNDPALATLKANWLNRNNTIHPETRFEAGDISAYR